VNGSTYQQWRIAEEKAETGDRDEDRRNSKTTARENTETTVRMTATAAKSRHWATLGDGVDAENQAYEGNSKGINGRDATEGMDANKALQSSTLPQRAARILERPAETQERRR